MKYTVIIIFILILFSSFASAQILGQFQDEPTEDELGAPLFYRIPYIEPREGQNKILSGEIKIDFEYPTIKYDTIMYDFYITDRALHKSNVESTSDISFTEWKNSL